MRQEKVKGTFPYTYVNKLNVFVKINFFSDTGLELNWVPLSIINYECSYRTVFWRYITRWIKQIRLVIAGMPNTSIFV